MDDSAKVAGLEADLTRVRAIMDRVRRISEDDVQAATATLGKSKVTVAKLIKEMRDLQDAIRKSLDHVEFHERESRTGDQQVAMEHLRAKEKHSEQVAHLRSQLQPLREMSGLIVDRIRDAELCLGDFRRFHSLVAAYDVSLQLERDVEQVRTVGGTLPLRENAINISDLETTLASLESRVQELRVDLTRRVSSNGNEGNGDSSGAHGDK